MLWGSTEMVRYIEAISCGYFLWDALVMIIYWKTPSTNFFDGVGLIHGVTCFIVYVTTLVIFIVFTVEVKISLIFFLLGKFRDHLECIIPHYTYYSNIQHHFCILDGSLEN